MNKTKVELISGSCSKDAQNKVNIFLERSNIEIIDIKACISSYIFVMVIIYKDAPPCEI